MHITFVSTFTPRKCGIATYTHDLAEALQEQRVVVSIAALDTKSLNLEYPEIVSIKIEEGLLADYIKAAEEINESSSDIIHIQHEFGIFGGEDGEYILEFAKALTKPFIVTFHTILAAPNPNQKRIMQELTRLSRAVIAMKEIGLDRLINIYAANQRDINIIYHGVPNMNYLSKSDIRKKLGLEKKFVIMSSNLISRNKGFEYVIKALPQIVKKIPEVVYIIIGETHPNVKRIEGESYRNELQQLTTDLDVTKHVVFVNEYVSLDRLKEYFVAADIFTTPYLDPEQITSGTLAYAIGAGKVCIATPYIYAKSLLKSNRGIIIPFRNDAEFSKNVIYIHSNSQKRRLFEKNARTLGKQMHWPYIAKKHNSLYKSILRTNGSLRKATLKFIKQQIDTTYLFTLTDTVGIAQHTSLRIPNSRHGYSTDDNARALIVAISLYKKTHSPQLFALVKAYLGFLFFAQEESGKFHTFLRAGTEWTDAGNISDAFAKALWGLGFFLYSHPTSPFAVNADQMFRRALNQVHNIESIRTISFTILGLHYYHKAFAEQKDSADSAYVALEHLANVLVEAYNKNSSVEWEWFEKEATYDNFRIPQALFLAYITTKNKSYKTIAEKSLNFLLLWNYNATGGYFDFIGQDGWLVQGKGKAFLDQQPLEAASAVSCLIIAYKVTKNKHYLQLAVEAFSWFLGKNRNHASLLDKLTGGIYDGLTITGVNENEGSESIICFLIAQLELQEMVKKD